ncbi:hypothetical protein RJT34_14401 [Clitoria ternatea]|uniref:TRF2/HOY1 PH-like domain-containing protein n=1 Tax=Clitoria ternatea TaxID=43366 RepID=A0AAN9JSK2_CLITE
MSNLWPIGEKIGAFEYKADERHVDLEVGCYYKTEKLTWEILDRVKLIKRKIEIDWNNILLIHAALEENKPGILEIHLEKPPKFYYEIDGKAGRSRWKPCEDFTKENEASRFRIHHVEFSHGVLNKHYKNILQSNNRLLQLSQSPLQSWISPYFDETPLLVNQQPLLPISPQQRVANTTSLSTSPGTGNMQQPSRDLDSGEYNVTTTMVTNSDPVIHVKEKHGLEDTVGVDQQLETKTEQMLHVVTQDSMFSELDETLFDFNDVDIERYRAELEEIPKQ